MKAPYYKEIVKRVPVDTPTTGLEIGIWMGELSEKLLFNLPYLYLIGVDPFEKAFNSRSYVDSGAKQVRTTDTESYIQAHMMAIEVYQKYADRSRILALSSAEAEKIFNEDDKFDFIFIDGDHSYESVLQDIEMWFPHTKEGGIICGHDYETKFAGVKKAVDKHFKKIELGTYNTWFFKKL